MSFGMWSVDGLPVGLPRVGLQRLGLRRGRGLPLVLLLVGMLALVLCPARGEAQDLLGLLTGKTGKKLKVQSPEERDMGRVEKRLKEVQARLEGVRKKEQSRKDSLEKETQRYREIIRRYRVVPEKKKKKKVAEVLLVLQADIVQAAEKNMLLSSQLQSAYSSRDQSLVTLRDLLKRYLKTRKNLVKMLEKRYVVGRRYEKLREDLEAVQKRIPKVQKELETIEAEQQRLNSQLEAHQSRLDKARRQLLRTEPLRPRVPLRKSPEREVDGDSPSEKTVPSGGKGSGQRGKASRRGRRGRKRGSRRGKRASRRRRKGSRRRRRAKKRGRGRRKSTRRRRRSQKRERAQRGEVPQPQGPSKAEKERRRRLSLLLKRLRFELLRTTSQMLQVRREDLALDRESGQLRLRLYRYVAEVSEKRLSSLASLTKGGLLYRQKPQLNRILLKKVAQRSADLVKEGPRQGWQVVQELSRNLFKLKKEKGTFLYVSVLLVLLVLSLLALVARRQLKKAVLGLSEREKAGTVTQKLWRTLLLAFQGAYDLLPYAVLLLLLALAVWLLELREDWNRMLLTLGLMLLLLRVVWTLANLLFSPEEQERFLKALDDDAARRFRRVFKVVAGFTFLYLPLLQAVTLLGYPPEMAQWMNILFYGIVVLCFLLLLLNKEAVLSLFPKDTRIGQWVGIFVGHVYSLFFFVALGVFAVYVWGYINLAAYLARSLVLTVVVLGGAYGIYQLLWGGVLWALGFSRGEKGLLQLERRWAASVSRFLRVFLGLVLGGASISLVLVVWGVARWGQALGRFFQYPFLQVQDTQITLLSLLKFVLAILVAVWFSRFLRRKLDELVYPVFRLTPSGRHEMNTVLGHGIVIVGIFAGLRWMGVGLGVLAVFAGVIGIGVGFGIQHAASNFISGLIITFGKPIKVGDFIELSGVMGTVQEISARSTTIETLDSRIILIPNTEILTTKVINWSMGPPYVHVQLNVGVAYGTNAKLVGDTLLEVARLHPEVLQDWPSVVRFGNFGDNALEFTLWVPVGQPTARFRILSELRFLVDEKFRQKGIVISFPQRDIHFTPELEEALIHSFEQEDRKAVGTRETGGTHERKRRGWAERKREERREGESQSHSTMPTEELPVFDPPAWMGQGLPGEKGGEKNVPRGMGEALPEKDARVEGSPEGGLSSSEKVTTKEEGEGKESTTPRKEEGEGKESATPRKEEGKGE